MTTFSIRPVHHEVAKRTGFSPPIVAVIDAGGKTSKTEAEVAAIRAAIAEVEIETFEPEVAAPARTRVYRAFGTERRSEAPYSFASRSERGRVRFHKSREAARSAAGRFGSVASVEVVR